MIDEAIVEEAAILTAIGIGAAFGLLVLLVVVVAILRLLSEGVLRMAARRAQAKVVREEAESRNRAHAAVAAVSAIMAARTGAGMAGGGRR